MSGKHLYVLYGSQTGNSEDIARAVAERCSDELELSDVNCGTLNSIKDNISNIKNIASMIIVVCSTTGNGDAPENALSFWRAVKLRSCSKDMFQDVPYCVLGLGDTNYDKFCHMGKSIDTRLKDLGGNRLLPVGCADEATGLEQVVDPWMDSIIEIVKQQLCSDAK